MKRNRKNISLTRQSRRRPLRQHKKEQQMIAPKVKIKKETRKAARSSYRSASSTVKSVRRDPTKKVNNGGAISGQSAARSKVKGAPLSPVALDKIDAYWRAANYLSVGQIY